MTVIILKITINIFEETERSYTDFIYRMTRKMNIINDRINNIEDPITFMFKSSAIKS